MTDCLAVTGTNTPVLLAALILGLLLAGLVLLGAGRRRGRRGGTLALTLAAVLIGGSLILVPGAPASANVDCEPGTKPTPAVSPTATPVPSLTPTPSVSPTPEPSPSASPSEPPAEQADFAVRFPAFILPAPPMSGDFSVRVPLAVANTSAIAGGASLDMEIAAAGNGHWSAVAVTDMAGAPLRDIVINPGPAGTAIITMTPAPQPGSERGFLVELLYHYDTWPHDFVTQPDGSMCRTARPTSEITVTLGAADAEPANNSATAALPGYGECSPAP
ncbi:hypothetical protein [Mycetocola spongiae]|uniref:hypothetical protein n=1 Tax=Mycetocola spongiae TaxID=2859226 RepID=UPI001CF28756|nr:hypothetical protein [Mycetocola spongiae]UCR89549.1 hypothetical protein KXZ72_02305 [Mycetocola spongiae]